MESDQIRLALLTRYARNGASSRLRFMQYLPWLERDGFSVEIHSFFDDAWLDAFYSGKRKRSQVPGAIFSRMGLLRRLKSANLIWVQSEALPWLPYWVERLAMPRGVPVVADYDDAIFHRYDRHRSALVLGLLGDKIDRVMAASDLVTAGNPYLAARAQVAGAKNTLIVPTVVDATAYRTKPLCPRDGLPRIGWIGTPGTWQRYMLPMLPDLLELAAQRNAKLRVIGAGISSQNHLESLPWSEETESRLIQGMQIGLMPLDDNPWSRGKCGYKIIQYMACGVPVIASPVGVNAEIIEDGVTGYLASTPSEWRSALERLLNDPKLRQRMGAAGRVRMEQRYSLQIWGPRVSEALRRVVNR